MKAVTTIILTLATLAFAAPNPNANAHANPAVLPTRQLGCRYSCHCQDKNGNADIRRTRYCCMDINAGNTCDLFTFELSVFRDCCPDNRYVCKPPADRPDCPEIAS
ncbi:hypothetical protein B0I37DRAFT_191407 [Chaetomium sp. MPI-CAGE-AT-0009]|nr:hypothetical protein B0I37DRAFT_191407 [Chaetomium sp. MPI-CAGE-AT-0009]